MKRPKFESENVLFRYFLARTLKNYCYIRNKHPQVFQIVKFCEKNNLNLVLQMPYLYWNFKAILSYLKSAPLNLYNWKILLNNENIETWRWKWLNLYYKCLIWMFLG